MMGKKAYSKKPVRERVEKKPQVQKVVINACYGGFGLSEKAYTKLVEWGVPVQKYHQQKRDPKTQLYKEQPLNDGEVIFDRELTLIEERDASDKAMSRIVGRYWETWLDGKRDHPLLIRVVEELGEEANGKCAKLKIVEIPLGVKFVIEEYDGFEHVAEAHETWS